MRDVAQPRVRILIVDDHRLFAESLMQALSTDDRLEVIGIANDGAEAVALSEALEPDVVFMDLDMPRVDGYEATRRITSSNGRAQVFVLTGNDMPGDAARAREAGAAAFLSKKYSISDLKDAFFEISSLTRAFGRRDPVVAE